MPIRIVATGVTCFGKFKKLNVFQYFYSSLCLEEILWWKNSYYFNVLALSHLRSFVGELGQGLSPGEQAGTGCLLGSQLTSSASLRPSKVKHGWQQWWWDSKRVRFGSHTTTAYPNPFMELWIYEVSLILITLCAKPNKGYLLIFQMKILSCPHGKQESQY